jgi:hypothetical protein
MQMPVIAKKVLGYLAPAKTFKESQTGTLDKVSRDFIKFLEGKPWRRAKVAGDVFEYAAETVLSARRNDITIPPGSNITILKQKKATGIVRPKIWVEGVLKSKSLTAFDDVDIKPSGKVIGLPQVNTIINDGIARKLGKAEEMLNYGKLQANHIVHLRNYLGATGYVKEVTNLSTNDGVLFADTVLIGTNHRKLFVQEGGEIHNYGGDISAQKVATLVKHLDANGVDIGTYQIGAIGETLTERTPELIY